VGLLRRPHIRHPLEHVDLPPLPRDANESAEPRHGAEQPEQWQIADRDRHRGRPPALAVRRRTSGEEREMRARIGKWATVPTRGRGDELRANDPRRRARWKCGPKRTAPVADLRSWVERRLQVPPGPSAMDDGGWGVDRPQYRLLRPQAPRRALDHWAGGKRGEKRNPNGGKAAVHAPF
jgi:hypothetical protein